MRLVCGGEAMPVRLEGEEAVLGERRVRFRVLGGSDRVEALEVDGRIYRVRAVRDRERVLVSCEGRLFEIQQESDRRRRSGEIGGDLVAPMPGRVRRVLVSEGAPVTRGEVVFVLEAMKMEHAIRAPRDGVVRSIGQREGDLVDAGAVLAEME